jgi:hypothetical protein
MKLQYIVLALVLLAAFTAVLSAQQASQDEAQRAIQEANVDAYIGLLRTDIKSQKVQVLSAVLQLTPEEASVFWAIYKTYDAELTKNSDERLAVISDYAENYGRLTDVKADDLVVKAMEIRQQRSAMFRKCYEEVKAKMGGLMAARFFQVENQLLLLIDLQISSMLPIAE